MRDYLDFRFQTGGETELTIEVLKKGGEEWELEVEREEGEDFGIQFENIVPRQCANECLFCFCKGNPPDARPALSFRDEDVRLSFLYGNYTTLTSITEDEMRRVVEQRLTPQYVSVHATDLKVRARLPTDLAPPRKRGPKGWLAKGMDASSLALSRMLPRVRTAPGGISDLETTGEPGRSTGRGDREEADLGDMTRGHREEGDDGAEARPEAVEVFVKEAPLELLLGRLSTGVVLSASDS